MATGRPVAVGVLVGLCLVGGLAGCNGAGDWARLEEMTTWAMDETVLFESVSAYFARRPDRYHRARPLVIHARARELDRQEAPTRTSYLMAFAEPGDVPGRIQVVAVVGQAERSGQPSWKLFLSRQDVEFWHFAGRFMIHGQVRLAESADTDFGKQRTFSASLRPSTSKGSFRKGLSRMIDRLEKMQSESGPSRGFPTDPSPLQETIIYLRRVLKK